MPVPSSCDDLVAKPAINAADRTSADAAHLLMRLGLILGFVVTPIALLFSQRSIFVLSPIAAALILIAGMVVAPRIRLKEAFAFLISPAGLGCLFVSLWAFASLLWTPFPAEAAPRLFKIVSTFLSVLPIAAVLPARSRAANLYVLPIGVTTASMGAVVLSQVLYPETHDAFAGETLSRAMSISLLLLWPAMMAAVLRGRVIMAAVVATFAVSAAVSVHATTALMATVVAALAFLAARADREKTGLWIGRIGAASFIFAPFLPLLFGPLIGNAAPSLTWLKVWNGILAADGIRLLTGHGFNYVASGYFHGYLGSETPKTSLFEIWTDLGALGALAGVGLSYWAYRLAASQTARVAPFWVGALTFVTAFGVFGGGTLQLWWITALAVALVALILATRGDFQTARPTAPRQAS
jgi:hypothetical protein